MLQSIKEVLYLDRIVLLKQKRELFYKLPVQIVAIILSKEFSSGVQLCHDVRQLALLLIRKILHDPNKYNRPQSTGGQLRQGDKEEGQELL